MNCSHFAPVTLKCIFKQNISEKVLHQQADLSLYGKVSLVVVHLQSD